MRGDRSVRRLVAVSLLLATAALSCARSAGPRQAVLIVLDAARADRFSCYGYSRPTTPRMDALAARGLVFEQHFVQSTHTRGSLPTLLFSRYYAQPLFPQSNRVPFSSPDDLFRAPDSESISLPKALSLSGLRTAMISAHLWLKPTTRFASEFDEAYDLSTLLEYDRRYRHPRAAQVVDFAINWIEKQGSREFFLYLHFMDTHFPHRLEEDGLRFLDSVGSAQPPLERFTVSGRPRDLERELSEGERHYLDALYDGDLRYVDRQLGRLFDHLGSRLEDTLIAIVSDHGEFLLDQPGRFAHGGPWYDTVGRVPFLLFYPARLGPGRVSSQTEGIDLMPTLLGLLDAPLPPGKRTDGVDLRPILEGEAPAKRTIFMKRSVRKEGTKCLFHARDEVLLAPSPPDIAALSGELYDLARDPDETVNLWSSSPELVADLLARYRARMIPPYRRYLAAERRDAPESPFAIAANHFFRNGAVRTTEDPQEVARFFESGEGWIQLKTPTGFHLLANAGAPPLRVLFPLPNGRYRGSAAIRGAGAIRIGEDGERKLEARPLDPGDPLPWLTEQSGFGPVEVRDERFTATLRPETSDSPFLIRFLGFEPIVDGAERDPGEQEELLERLKALGYVD